MVGFVVVSRNESLARSVVELTSIMTPSTRVAPAGDMDDGDFGTSFGKIQTAIESIYSDDGVLIPVDLKSAAMIAEMVIEILREKEVEMVDYPLVEDAVVVAIDTVGGMSFEDIKATLAGVGKAKKF